MYKFDYTDMVAGALLVVTGASVAFVAATSYPLGTLARMGPGLFPAALGTILALFGVILAVQSLSRRGTRPDIRIWSPLFVLGSVVAFAVIVTPFGLIPAIIAVTVISSLAELRLRPTSLALLCLGLCLFAPFVFRVCLGLSIPLVRWPF